MSPRNMKQLEISYKNSAAPPVFGYPDETLFLVFDILHPNTAEWIKNEEQPSFFNRLRGVLLPDTLKPFIILGEAKVRKILC